MDPPPMAQPTLLPLLSSVAFWLLASLVVGAVANQLPPRWLEAAGPAPPHRLPPRRPAGPLGIRLWKRWIPDAGGALPGGVAKASLVRREPAALRRLLLETRRAELVHGLLWPAGLLTALWLPPAGVLVNLVFATAFNLPCLLLQRYNRTRLRHCLARLEREAA
jgi:glycosyl-4,4'-diaponeurosporenoate acyltransferase